MIKPVYNIGIPEISSVDWSQCRLVIEMNQYFFHFVILQEKEAVLTLRYYQFPSKKPGDIKSYMEEILESDEILKKQMQEVFVIYNWPENCFIPEKYFNQNLNREYLELIHGDIYNNIILSEKINTGDIYNVFRLPSQIHDFFIQNFPTARYNHYYSVWYESQQKEKNDQQDTVNVLFYRNNILVTVTINHQVQLIQSMEYQTAEDVAYHLLNICHQFKIKQEETIFRISGMIDQNSAMYKELLKYFLIIEISQLPSELKLPEDMQAFPEHFFLPLLKQAVCVS